MRVIKISKEITELDEIVFKFVSILEKHVRYVIVSGYVAILLGENRPTQDVDVLIENIEKERARKLYEELSNNGFYFAENFDDFYRFLFELKEKVDIFSEKLWYFDLKSVKDFFDVFSIENRIKVIVNEMFQLFISPPELQIPYKIYLGADKDLKDAAFLYEKFKEIIDKEKMQRIADEIGISLKVLENV